MTRQAAPLPVLTRVGRSIGSLTPGQRRLADWLLCNPRTAAFRGVEAWAEEAGSSIASVVRFARALGYAGFAELRQALADEVQAEFGLAGIESRLLQAPAGAAETLVEVARRDLANIERTVGAIDEARLREAVRLLTRARHRLLIGLGVSQVMAAALGYLLTQAGLPCISGSPVDFANQASLLDRRDLLIAFSFPPYSRETLDAADLARRHGVPVLAFADRLDSPLGKRAETTLPVAGENLLYSHSLAAFGVLAHSLAVAVASRDRRATLARVREADRVAQFQYLED